jgi:hypothetical protein
MKTLPKRPSELLAIMTEQYEEPEVDMFGQSRRGGRGKKKGKNFFQVSSESLFYQIIANDGWIIEGTPDLVWNSILLG